MSSWCYIACDAAKDWRKIVPSVRPLLTLQSIALFEQKGAAVALWVNSITVIRSSSLSLPPGNATIFRMFVRWIWHTGWSPTIILYHITRKLAQWVYSASFNSLYKSWRKVTGAWWTIYVTLSSSEIPCYADNPNFTKALMPSEIIIVYCFNPKLS